MPGLLPGWNRDKALRMVLAHELGGDPHTGDIIPGDQVPREEKQRLERKRALEVWLEKLPNGQEFVDLWEEFETGRQP